MSEPSYETVSLSSGDRQPTSDYPAAPWTLRGYALQTLHWIDTDRARSLVPPHLEIVSILPGKTLGGIYLSHYDSQSTLSYNELIVVPALARSGSTIAPWISHIYVDHPQSVAGGRHIWGLPKELAQFTWQPDRVSVQQDGQPLCSLDHSWHLPLWPQSLSFNTFTTLSSDLFLFQGKAKANLQVIGASLSIPESSAFAQLTLGQPWLAMRGNDLKLVVDAPRMV